jgi:lytic polysaccharide monooxygenase AA14-like protein
MQGFKCNVTDSTSNKTLAAAKPPVYCGDGKNECVTGAKQMMAWHRQSFPISIMFP